MYLKKLKLTNFRNYINQEIVFINGINLFLGNNAQGKTNIIEAIYLSALGTSYRTIKDIEVIRFNENFCRVELEYTKYDDYISDSHHIEVYIDNNNIKNIKEDSVKVTKLIDHVGRLPIVIFSPDSLDILKGSPQKRRKFLDMICCQLSKSYYINLQEYNKCLKIKNSLLKKNIKDIDRDYISIIHDKMSEYIYNIVFFRNEIIELIQKKSKIIHNKLTDSKEDLKIKYLSDFTNLNKDKIKIILDKYFEIEIFRKSSLKGIQRDDIAVYINELEVDKYCSQGQNRTALLTLKLAEFEVLIEKKQVVPILLLDDIMSELDQSRISFLLNYIEQYQSIITTTDAEFIKNIEKIKISKVLNGTIEN
ncbi:MAG: DNA replication/repair protein RecF [Clostridia bacterium]|nr:DNA replication/repair protein RecF [Clostridia bacterium]